MNKVNHKLLEVVTPFDILELPLLNIERCGRLSYKSTSPINIETATKFMNDRIKSGHLSVLEHGFVALVVQDDFWAYILSTMNRHKGILEYDVMPYIKYRKLRNTNSYFVLMNYRCAYNFIKIVLSYNVVGLIPFVGKLHDTHMKRVFKDFIIGMPQFDHTAVKTTMVYTSTIQRYKEEIIDMLPYTMIMDTNRGVTHELVRHRKAKFVQESTRFCNYSKDRFTKSLTIIENHNVTGWYNKLIYNFVLYVIEWGYMKLVKRGVQAQIARGILPNDLKSTIAITAHVAEWEDIIDQRWYNTAAHPHMRVLMMDIFNEFKVLLPNIFQTE